MLTRRVVQHQQWVAEGTETTSRIPCWVSMSVEDCNIHVCFMHVCWGFFLEILSGGGWSYTAQIPEQALSIQKWFCKCTRCMTLSHLEFCLSIKCISCCSVANSIAIVAKLKVKLYRRGRWFYYKTSWFCLLTLPYSHIHKPFELFRSLQWIGTFISPSFPTSVSHEGLRSLLSLGLGV